MNILENITLEELKLLTTKDNAQTVLNLLQIPHKKNQIFEKLLEHFNYEIYKKTFRQVAFDKGGKYDTTQIPHFLEKRKEMIGVYKQKFPNDKSLQWCYSPDGYDDFRKKCTFGMITEQQYLDGVYKHYLTASISDLTSKVTERYIVSNNENIFPTLKNTGGIDYIYKGRPKDIKNSKSLGGLFIDWCKEQGLNPKQEAINNPAQVIKCLYEGQSETRFGSEPRHLIVNLNDEILTNEKLLQMLETVDLDDEKEITFINKKTGKTYITTALITYI